MTNTPPDKAAYKKAASLGCGIIISWLMGIAVLIGAGKWELAATTAVSGVIMTTGVGLLFSKEITRKGLD